MRRKCERCHTDKPPQAFRKTGGRYRRRICIVCDDAERKVKWLAKRDEGPRVVLVCAGCRSPVERPAIYRPKSLEHRAVYCGNPCRAPSPRKGGTALSPFRFFTYGPKHNKNRGSARGRPSELSSEYLQKVWFAQGGICPLTGWALVLPSVGKNKWPDGHSPRNASIDRVDQSRGYIRGNVRFVALIANYARHSWADSDVLSFAEAVVLNVKQRKNQ